ncbi:MAG: DUF5681 domain-containing protein [Chloroflexota bacterium]|nr:DUF5681 domain-containing protein [Chloroflexota bacterium]
MPFIKGQSGNPSGRPRKGDALADLISDAMSRDDEIAIVRQAVFTAKLGDKDARQWLFDRKYGKAPQGVEISGDGGDPIEILVTYANPHDPAAPPASGPAPDPAGEAAL